MSVNKIGVPSIGEVGCVHTTQMNPIGLIVEGENGEEFIYLQGIGSTVEGSWVTYDELGVTTLLVAHAIGPVAVATAATVADTYGWYCIYAPAGIDAIFAASSAADAATGIGFETTAGYAGDGKATGHRIYGVLQRESNTAAGLATVQIYAHPFVDDGYGA